MTPKTRADAPLPNGWRFLASMQLTIFLLLVLAATSVIGTLIPQGGEPGDYIRTYGYFGYRLLHGNPGQSAAVQSPELPELP